MLRNTTKIASVALVMVMVLGVFAALMPALTASPAKTVISDPEAMTVDYSKQPIDMEKFYYSAAAEKVRAAVIAPGAYYDVGAVAYYYLDGMGKQSWMQFEKRAEGNHCEVWSALDLTFPAGDLRNIPDYIKVSNTSVQELVWSFDNMTYPNETEFYGPVPPRNGSDATVQQQYGYPSFQTNDTGKVMIMIFNIVDEFYLDPTYPGGYVAGYSWGYVDSLYDRTIIHLDNWKFDNRTGPGHGSRSWLYDSVAAHEMTHEFYAWYNDAPTTFINEGMADFSMLICGFPQDWSHVTAFLYTPDNSLVDWGDQGGANILADYGAAFLFITYLADHFGPEIVQALVDANVTGTAAIDEAFVVTNHNDWNFVKVFKYWRLANLIMSDTPGRGWFNYNSIDFYDNTYGVYQVWVNSFVVNPGGYNYVSSASDYFGESFGAFAGPLGVSGVGAWGTDYIYVENGPIAPSQPSGWGAGFDPYELKFAFDGGEQAVEGWQITETPALSVGDGNVWWSGAGNDKDFRLVGTADLTDMETATLTFDTAYDIEATWDFGFVQVSTNGGESWTSLANGYTTMDSNPDAAPEIVAQLPGITGDHAALTMSFDLSQYVGQEIMFQFRYMTDSGTNGEGWFVDNVKINGVLYDNADDVLNLVVEPSYPMINNWYVTLFFPQASFDGVNYLPIIMDVNIQDMENFAALRALTSMLVYDTMIIIVSPDVGPADYGFGIINTYEGMIG